MNHAHAIESILFATAEPQSIKNLATLLDTTPEMIIEALRTLETSFEDHGIMLVQNGDEVTLATKPEHAPLIEKIRKEELNKELTKASAETLAVVIYHPGATKADIEMIRGVNASYSLRALHMRGLVETKGTGRSVTYHPTLELLNHFGVASVEGLPAYAETKGKIDALLTSQQSTIE